MNWNDKSNSSYEEINPFFLISEFATDSLQTGDIIMRSGTGIYSAVNRYVFSKSHKYSHCGIISIEHDTIFVYHALGGRESVTNQLRKDELMHYCNKKATCGVSFYRYTLDEIQKNKLQNLIIKLYDNQTLFDLYFDMDDTNELYHTEFIYFALAAVTNNPEIIPISYFLGKKYISFDNIYQNSNVVPLASFDFQ